MVNTDLTGIWHNLYLSFTLVRTSRPLYDLTHHRAATWQHNTTSDKFHALVPDDQLVTAAASRQQEHWLSLPVALMWHKQ